MFWFVFILIFSFVFTCLKGSFLNPSSKGGAMYTSLSCVWGGRCTENASLSHFSKKANFPVLHVGGWCTNGDWRLSVNPGQECLLLDGVGSGEGHFSSPWSPGSGVSTLSGQGRGRFHHQASRCWGSIRLWARTWHRGPWGCLRVITETNAENPGLAFVPKSKWLTLLRFAGSIGPAWISSVQG